MVLLCAEGLQSKEVAARLNVHEHTVGKWRRRFVQDGIEGLADEYRAGRPRSVSDGPVAGVIERTLNTMPKDATHWSSAPWQPILGCRTPPSAESGVHLACSHTGQRHSAVDPLFVDKVQDIVGLYMSPPHRAAVLCVDEKSQIQALDREQPVLPMAPGVPEQRTHTYIRNGTTSLFAALDIATGAVIGKCYKRHRATEFLDFLKRIDAEMPKGPDVHLVMDNYATHKTPKIKAWLARRPHWHVHFTPTSASWINQVERWFAELTRKQLQRGVHRSTAELEADIMHSLRLTRKTPSPTNG
ncbi:IS630 family transposase [Sphingobium sp. TomTYG75]